MIWKEYEVTESVMGNYQCQFDWIKEYQEGERAYY